MDTFWSSNREWNALRQGIKALPDVASVDFHRNERATGRFLRSYELGCAIDEGKVNAEYRDGILTITLPKSEEAKPRQISVSVK